MGLSLYKTRAKILESTVRKHTYAKLELIKE